jgi:DNA repair photolyase
VNATTIQPKTILTPTNGRGFLAPAFTHTLNPSSGCSFGNAACGVFCYAQHLPQRRGRAWGSYLDTKDPASVLRAYESQRARLARASAPLRIFMSSATDPYVPQEAVVRLLPRLYDLMATDPPDVLVVQTRSPLVTRDIDPLLALADVSHVIVNVTVETDSDPLPIPGLSPHATPIAKRIQALGQLRDAGVPTQATVSPLLPIADIEGFIRTLLSVADRVIVDHYAIGDGSRGGARTETTGFPSLLTNAGYGYWNTLPALDHVLGVGAAIAPDRVLRSRAGFGDLRPFHPTHHAVANRVAQMESTPRGDLRLF